MTPHYTDATVQLYNGDCLDVLCQLPDNSVDAVVTDPPYNLSFMGREWDSHADTVTFQAWCEQWSTECLRVLKPGGHLLAFGGTRTFHRLACAVEDAGFEVRDSIAWLYGSGFPKSLDVSKAIDKARGDDPAWREVGQWLKDHREAAGYATRKTFAPLILDGHKNIESAAANLSNWENGLSFPTWEWWLSLKEILSLPDDMDAEVWRLNGRKGSPGEAWDQREVLSTRKQRSNANNPDRHVGLLASTHEVETITAPATVAARQWAGWGTALKPAFEPVVVARKPLTGTVAQNVQAYGTGALNIDACRIGDDDTRRHKTAEMGYHGGNLAESYGTGSSAGRWPANVALDDTQADALDQQSGETSNHARRDGRIGQGRDLNPSSFGSRTEVTETTVPTDSGGASRFFYVAKADASERPRVAGVAHPTVKPLALMRWLVRLVTPPGGTVLEPFAGSGTTVEACILEGFKCIAIEREADYLPLILGRIHRRRDPIAAVKLNGDDGGLFDLLDEEPA